MRSIHRFAVLPLVVLLPLLVGCNKRPAREALSESDQVLVAARPQLEQFAPEELPSLQAAAADAHAHYEAGRYTDALEIAQKLPARVEVALAKAGSRKGELDAAWSALSGRVPLILEGVEARVRELASTARLPRPLTPDSFAVLQDELATARRAWTEARALFEAGQAAAAVSVGRGVRARVEGAAVQLGLAPAVAAAGSTTPAPTPRATTAPPTAVPQPPAAAAPRLAPTTTTTTTLAPVEAVPPTTPPQP